MAFTRVPKRIYGICGLLLMSLAFGFVHLLFYKDRTVLQISLQELQNWGIPLVVGFFLVSLLLVQGSVWSARILTFLAALWIGIVAFQAVVLWNFWLGIFLFILSFYFIFMIWLLRRELRRSYEIPRIPWYQGMPQALPALICELDPTGTPPLSAAILKVSRIDSEGTFIYFDDRKKDEDRRKQLKQRFQAKKIVLKIRCKERTVLCQGTPVRILNKGDGIGVRFSSMHPDGKKELGDFVEWLKGEGYVHD